MSTQPPASSSRIAPQPSPIYGAAHVVDCPTCGTYPAESADQAETRAEWCRQFDHGPAKAREV